MRASRDSLTGIVAGGLNWLRPKPSSQWASRCGLLGLSLGLVSGTMSAGLRLFSQREGPLIDASSLGVGALVTALGYFLAAWAYGVVTAQLAERPRTWALAKGVAAGLLGACVWVDLTSFLLWLSSGSFLSYGTLEFALNSSSHLADALVQNHLDVMLVSIALVAIVLVGSFTWLGRPLGIRYSRGRSPGTVHAVFVLPLALLLVTHAAKGGLEASPALSATPELALWSSFRQARRDIRVSHNATRDSGPPLEAGGLWRQAAMPSVEPNVLLILLESVSTRHIGHLGAREGVTPQLDALAENGLSMQRAWTTATHSNYAQMAVLSSLFPRRGAGLDTYRQLNYPRFLLHDLLDAFGYVTASISSQDESWQGMHLFQDTETPTSFFDSRSHTGEHVSIGSELVVPDHVTADKAIAWISSQTRPWSLYVNFQATHFPYALADGVPRPFKPDQPTAGSFDYLDYPEDEHLVAVNRYKNALSYVDQQIGRVVEALAAVNALDDTIVVVTSDHGEMFHEHGLVTHGRTLYEEEARVPLVLHWPERIEPELSDVPVSTLDILPTIQALLDVPPHPSHQGEAFFPTPEDSENRPAVLLNIQGFRSMEGLVCWPFKLVRDVHSQRLSLYNLEKDPIEAHSLVGEERELTQRLADTLTKAMSAQEQYHRGEQPEKHFAPRLPQCPSPQREPARSDVL